MQLLKATRDILTMVESITDRKVEFVPQKKMPVMALPGQTNSTES